jgi:hypothetical protein
MAVEEGEFDMAHHVFQNIKDWISQIQKESLDLLESNMKVMFAVNNTLQQGLRTMRIMAATRAGYPASEAIALENNIETIDDTYERSSPGELGGAVKAAVYAAQASQRKVFEKVRQREREEVLEEGRKGARTPSPVKSLDASQNDGNHTAMVPLNAKDYALAQADKAMSLEFEPIHRALEMLNQIDQLLKLHGRYWSRMEGIVDGLMRDTQSAESMVNYTRNPKLRDRFLTRVDDYEATWDKIHAICSTFHNNAQHDIMESRLYGFLNNVE